LRKKKLIIPGILAAAAFLFFSQKQIQPQVEAVTAAAKTITTSKSASVAILKNPAAPAAPATEEQTRYEAQLTQVIEEMPTLTQQSQPKVDGDNEIHGLQADEFKEGQKLAELRKLSLANEKFVASTQTVYADCSQRQDFAASVRAVCFMRAMELSIKLKNPQFVVQLNVPADVRQLALKLVN
jgi:hypothetical protein